MKDDKVYDMTHANDVIRVNDKVPALLGRMGTGGNQVPLTMTKSKVRRLTPVECERLQGFPDNWTRIPYKGKPEDKCPDMPRYKAIGNSWAVPCVRWIGERIQEELNRSEGKKYAEEQEQTQEELGARVEPQCGSLPSEKAS